MDKNFIHFLLFIHFQNKNNINYLTKFNIYKLNILYNDLY